MLTNNYNYCYNCFLLLPIKLIDCRFLTSELIVQCFKSIHKLALFKQNFISDFLKCSQEVRINYCKLVGFLMQIVCLSVFALFFENILILSDLYPLIEI